MSKKYQEFKIKITYLNGDSEEINYNKQDKSKYRDMLELYKQTKEKFKDECVIIDFLGVEGDGELGILFQKKIVNDKESKIKTQADLVRNMPLSEVLDQMESLMKILEDKSSKSDERINVYNKRQDLLLHKVEGFKKAKVSNVGKLEVMDMLEDIRLKRRVIKNDVRVIDDFKENNSMQIIKQAIFRSKLKIDSISKEDSEMEYLTDEKIEQFKMMKEVTYKSFKERIVVMKRLQNRYNKVYYDDSTMVITCYNKASRY